MFSLFASHSFAVSFEKNCKVPKGSIKTIKIDGEKYTQFTLKDKDKGGCSTDKKSRSGAPYWERAELAQRNTLSKNKIHEISFKVKIVEGFKGERETFFQIHNYNKSAKSVYPSIMLKFDDGFYASTSTRPSNLQLDFMIVDYKHSHLNRKDIPLANLKNEWQYFKVILSKIDKNRDWSICDAYGYKSMFCYGKDGEILSENERKKYDNDNKNPKEIGYVTIYLNNDIIFNKIKTYFPKRGTPRIKYGIYRPGNLEGNNTSQIIYSKINVNSKK